MLLEGPEYQVSCIPELRQRPEDPLPSEQALGGSLIALPGAFCPPNARGLLHPTPVTGGPPR